MGSRNQLLDNSRLGVVEVLAVVAVVVVALDVRDVSGRTPLRQNNGATAVPSSPPVGTLSNGLQLIFAMQLLVKCQQVFGLAWQANTHWHFTSSCIGKKELRTPSPRGPAVQDGSSGGGRSVRTSCERQAMVVSPSPKLRILLNLQCARHALGRKPNGRGHCCS